ncbi:MAG: hypothetical protein SFY56_06000 [Bacteroidota bacterium]|nr:hypothetical protein [Bacteroidota bacterium]
MKSEKIAQIIQQVKSGKPYNFWKGRQNGNYIDEYADYTIKLNEKFTVTGCYHDDKTNSDLNFSIEKTEPELMEWLNGFDEQFLK